ncbi:hypothetical protein STH8232_1051 [Streptococcus thermophilus JIM 8232]|nr:hypothetical protein STH8232_1051 [Streptococcus thermophilus JIM 8232]
MLVVLLQHTCLKFTSSKFRKRFAMGIRSSYFTQFFLPHYTLSDPLETG